MTWFWNRKRKQSWDIALVEHPWSGELSIHDHIANHVVDGVRGLAEGGEQLPDEKNDSRVKWIAGGFDGAFGHHGGSVDEERAKLLYQAIEVVLEDASAHNVRLLYEQLAKPGAFEVVDALLALIVQKQDLDGNRLQELAVWLARHAPDREPVKLAISILGILTTANQQDLLLRLGRHEEFTLYVAVAISNVSGGKAEVALWELAEHVKGWGRIQVVERLTNTTSPEIKAWLLREGYKNSIMHEYLAYACAVAGELRTELDKPTVDPLLLAGARDIIVALIAGGPAQSMEDYADGAVVVERYLHHIGDYPHDLAALIAIDRIENFLQEEVDWSVRESSGWTPELRTALLTRTHALKALPHWQDTVASALELRDRVTFARADLAAKAIGVDTWQHHFSRLKAGIDDGWYHVMQTQDPARIDRVLELAEKVMPLGEIATGSGDALGLGLEWSNHGHLDFVLQDLRRFPGKGWVFIRTGLRSPVVRNRHMALRALSSWDQEAWPPDAKTFLRDSLQDEPNKDVRDGIQTLLDGRKLAEDAIAAQSG